MVVLLIAFLLNRHRGQAEDWILFSIGPASGESVSIQPTRMWSTGVTLKVAVATAYEVPAVRVLGPEWLGQTRYAINAIAGADASASFRSMLRDELNDRFRLKTHADVRPFDVFVLTATDTPPLEVSMGKNRNTGIHEKDATLQDASMGGLASALEAILGRPVIDETGIAGSYDFEFGWSKDRVAAITAGSSTGCYLHRASGISKR
jgi:uncharacterized protein (TIGR03435 family)